MGKENSSKNLCICFEIEESSPFSEKPQPFLTFKNSNYDLSANEILRAKLRSDKLTLDNKVTYSKVDEEAYLNRDGENMLKIKYDKLG